MAPKTLQGWKEIAGHIGRGVRTVQRWEKLGLPVRRVKGGDQGAVFAFPADLDHWMSSTRVAGTGDPTASGNEHFHYRVLVVDDEPCIRQTAKALLESQGYEVRLAEDGFDALNHLTQAVPDILISDLRMPNMSGFELLSVVRKRFPQIGVIAVSGEFLPAQAVDSILADAFIPKGQSAEELFNKIIALLEQAPIRPRLKRSEQAAVWIPRNRHDYVVVTCPYCLRTSPASQPAGDEVQLLECPHCVRLITFRMVPGALKTDSATTGSPIVPPR